MERVGFETERVERDIGLGEGTGVGERDGGLEGGAELTIVVFSSVLEQVSGTKIKDRKTVVLVYSRAYVLERGRGWKS